MTTSMYGSPLGFQEFDKGQQAALVNTALARLHNSNAAAAEGNTARQAEMMALLAQPEPAPQGVRDPSFVGPQMPGSPEGMLVQLGRGRTALETATEKLGADANKLLRAGFIKEGEAAAKAVSEIALKGQQLLTSKSQAAFRDNQVLHANMKELNGLMSGVTDAASFDKAKLIYMSRHPEDPIPPEMERYDPRLVEAILNGTSDGMKRIELSMREEENDSKDSLRKARERYMTWRKGHSEALLKLRKDESARKVKEGKDVGTPTPGEIAQAARTITAEYKDTLPAADVNMAAYDIAARAKALRKANPGIDAGRSIQQAMDEAKPSFQTTVKAVTGLKALDDMLGKKGTAYKGGTPAPVPVDKKSWVVGKDYTLENGIVGTWTGQGFKPKATNPRMGAGLVSEAPLEGEDEGALIDEEDE